MPQYHYEHERCGMVQDLFLREDKETKQVNCYRCGLVVTARQVRDNSVKVAENDGTIGLIKQPKPGGQNESRNSKY